MKPGDNVYFFIDRKIYGIGELVNLSLDCKFKNYPNADVPETPNHNETRKLMLLDNINELMIFDSKDKQPITNLRNRCLCIFMYSPYFFKTGVDMDDILSYRPNSFKMLRALWKLSFIKIDDEENMALKSIILKRNEESLHSGEHTYSFSNKIHTSILTKLTPEHRLTSRTLMDICSRRNLLNHEMALELGIIDILSSNSPSIFGCWDYISHQVVASPFKPIDYMDKMDIFGYKYIPGFPVISQYLVMELKKDAATNEGIEQLMKYVDWINKEYTFEDYSMITAYMVASDFSEDVIAYARNICIRNFMRGIRPTVSLTWNNIRLIRYAYSDNKLVFTEVPL